MDGTDYVGRMGYDSVCPVNDTDSCATDFLFDLIVEVNYHIPNDVLEGILGMWTGDVSWAVQEEMFMNKMFETSTLDKKIFSVFLGNHD